MGRRQLNRQITRVSMFQALRAGRIVILFSILITYFVQFYYHYPVPTFVIGIIYLILPYVICFIMPKKVMKEELSSLKEHYHYDEEKYRAYVWSFYVVMTLLIAWKKANERSYISTDFIKYAPDRIMMIGVSVVLVVFFIYRIMLPYRIKNNLM